MGGTAGGVGYSIAVDKNENIYSTGTIGPNATVDFDPGAATFNLNTPLTSYNIFVQKLLPDVDLGVLENSFEEEIQVYPNPTDGNFSVDLGTSFEFVRIVVADITGKVIQLNSFAEGQIFKMSLEKPSGIYLLTILADDKNAVIRLVIE